MVTAKKNPFVPSKAELDWARNMLELVGVGYVWSSKYAIYYRESAMVLACIHSLDGEKAPIYLTEMEIHRVKTVMKKLGFTFIDRRFKNN
jgi:hypothetical protein